MVWALALEGKDDCKRFKELGWGLRTWDQWEFNACDKRFGDDWPGRIPAQLIAHILFYFSRPGDLVLDPMAGGGVTPDTCLALDRRCWAFDMMDRAKRPEADWRDFQNTPASEEASKGAILIGDYLDILKRTGWQYTHIIQAPMSAQRFSAVVVSAMQKKRILGVTSRYVLVLKQAV
jgi:hypothetical protein